MPFLRVVRDKRGYETTYLIHSFREGTHQGSRVLYAFRSPAGVRVGRDAFEPDVRRDIERSNPDIDFDWNALVSARQVIDSTPEQRRPRRRSGGDGAPDALPARRPESQARPPHLAVPSVIQGDTPETRMRFLAHWHGILCEQLPLRITDATRRDALMALTQRLNPAGWLDADEIASGVQAAAAALEQLSRALSKRRKKSRRGGQRDGGRGVERTPGPDGPATVAVDEDRGEPHAEVVAEIDGDSSDEPDSA